MHDKPVEELLLQSLEHEIGGEKIYDLALSCVMNPELKQVWSRYLAETKTHVAALQRVCEALSLDPAKETPGRAVVRQVGTALRDAIRSARSAGDPAAAELVAAECVVLAETKDHLDWELLGKCAEYMAGNAGKALNAAYESIEDQEDEHLYHSKGFCRELWIQYLGMHPVLPPPEETEKVKTAIAAAKAEQKADEDR
jgi:rubrerythrin